MDWIERWFGFAPDNGDGSVEALVFIALVVLAFCLLATTWAPLRTRLLMAARKTAAVLLSLRR
jgi:hypothetical protein